MPTNPGKYFGTLPIISRSGWEYQAMMLFDKHPSIIKWASESVSVPYRNPLTGKMTLYIPDFILVYEDRNGAQRAEMIEIKPEKESPLFEGKVSKETRLVQAINAAKWQAASAWCSKNGMKFRVLSEREMFGRARGSK